MSRGRKNNLNPSYTFESFVVSRSNRFAYEVARSISSAPGGNHNPVLIYGEEGTGKTHLLHAIGNEIALQSPEVKVCYMPILTLERGLWIASQLRKTHEILKIFDYHDVFLIDDLHRIGYKALLLLLFYIPGLCHRKQQVVMAYDGSCVPDDEREVLIDSFEGLLMVDVQPHETETRKEIIIRKAKARYGIQVPEEVSDFISCTDYPLKKLDFLFDKMKPIIEETKGCIDLDTIKDLTGYKEKRVIDRVKIDHLIEEFKNRYLDDIDILLQEISRIRKKIGS
ncbi:MAG: ATP-binding protein [Nitrospirae bacterium]|nr:ATP-binding protein [Nitrospirota bacterium]